MRSQNSTRHKRAKEILKKMVEDKQNFNTTFVNVYELYKGAYRTKDVKGSIRKINRYLQVINVLEHTDEYYDIYGEISADLEKKGTPIGKFDEMVAAIAIHNGAKILTNNTKDFARIPGLEIISH
ncbi:type II toxin-antitoxin system VapC family toxin [Methanoplanus endosymbiosus]|uniref:Type II toxin-antitoxin system VapC family toxin n=1 Tax=Methanoplanus endosymbiosus TaxID=33865 RepID=A0A9E7TN10_9EURY|nr:type II toxin-antitoxin system VapC family toxin [Methanoplanus endosymbiosus]UUX93916.1 type II toxin-antitoxin system VapC family toxin [Methanoplanus endosymbiosus]